MSQANPLLRKPQLPPIRGQNTGTDIEDRLRATRNPANLLLSYAKLDGQTLTVNKPKQSKTSAAVHISISQEDQLPSDFVEGKEPYESIAFGPLNQDPEGIFTFVESNFQIRFKNWKIQQIHEQQFGAERI